MATVITSTLKASGGDYTTIKSWLSAMLSAYPNLVTSDVILELQCYNDWPSGLDENFVDFKSGFTTDADHKFRIVAADGEGHTGVAGTGFRFSSTSTVYAFYSRSKHVEFDGIEFSAPDASRPLFDASSNTIVKNSILHDIASSGFSATSGAEFENCIAYLTAPSSSGNVGQAFWLARLTNVTAYISDLSGGFDGDIVFHTCDCTNVYMYHNVAKASYDSFYNCTGDYNAGLAINGEIPGANSFFITDDSDLEDPDNFDFRLKSTSPLMTAGENGGPIGAVFASTPSGSVISEVYGIKSEQLINQLDSVKSSTSNASIITSAQNVSELASNKISTSEVDAVKSSQLLLVIGSVKAAVSTVNAIKSEQIINEIDSVKTSTSNLSVISSLHKVASLGSVKLSASAISTISSPQKVALISDSGDTASVIYAIKAGQSVAFLTSIKLAKSTVVTLESKQLLNTIDSIATRVSGLSATKSEGLIASLYSYSIKSSSAAAIKSSQKISIVNSYAVKVSDAYAVKSAQLVNGIYKYTGTMPTFGWDDVVTISKTKSTTIKSETKLHSVISTSKTYNTESKTKIMRVTNDLH